MKGELKVERKYSEKSQVEEENQSAEEESKYGFFCSFKFLQVLI